MDKHLIALLRAAAATGESVVLSAFRCQELVDALDHTHGHEEPWGRLDTVSAAHALGIPETTARARARRYWAMIQAGKEPPVRVWPELSESGAVVRWYFHEGDCFRARRKRAEVPASKTRLRNAPALLGVDEQTELDRTLQMWGDRAVGV
jgi:hypothetical protein